MLILLKINTVADVERFFRQLVTVESLNFHPDDPFSDYISFSDGKPTYTESQAAVRQSLMDRCFDVCEPFGDGFIYDIGTRVFTEFIY